MPPGRRRRLLRQQQWGVNCLRRVPRRLAARALPRERALRMLWRSSPPGGVGALSVGGTSAAAETGVTDAVEVFPAGGVRRLGRGASGARRERTNPPGRRLPVLFATRHHYLSRRNERASITGTTARPIEHAERHSSDRICTGAWSSRPAPAD